MARRSREEIFDPFCSLDENGHSEKERIDIWRSQCWAYFLNGGGGDPRYFDYLAVIRMNRHERER
jgi:hypothetical protein